MNLHEPFGGLLQNGRGQEEVSSFNSVFIRLLVDVTIYKVKIMQKRSQAVKIKSFVTTINV